MTRLADRKTPATAETSAVVQGRPLCVLLTPHELLIRQKGRKFAYAVPFLAIYHLGAELHLAEQRRAKTEAKGVNNGR